jgi:ankyrin repeat protein
MSDALPLPPRPNLEQYKKLARDLQVACQSGETQAVRLWAKRWVADREADRMVQRWEKLRKSQEHVADCTLTGVQFFIAREHGFPSWPVFARHVQEMVRAQSPESAFEAAADAIVSGDITTLRGLLTSHPDLVNQRSTREHHSTLLHYVSANGIEDFRQKTPKNIVEITKLLLEAGAEVDAQSDAYGGGSTPLGLVATSVHPEQAGVQIELLQTLLNRGASVYQRSAGGNGQSVVNACLANGQPGAARFLADAGAPLDVEGAAALGRLDVLGAFFDENRAGRPPIGPKELTSAFLYACGYGSREGVEFLLTHGVDPGVRNGEGQTGLHWANYAPQIDIIRLLLERGAPVSVKDEQYHATPLDMALWTWSNAREAGRRERCYEAIALLSRAGATLNPDHWRNAGETDSPMLQKIHSDPRMLASLEGELP